MKIKIIKNGIKLIAETLYEAKLLSSIYDNEDKYFIASYRHWKKFNPYINFVEIIKVDNKK